MHIARFVRLLQEEDSPDRSRALEQLYLIRSDKQYIWELIGVRVRGHPSVMLGAVGLPRFSGQSEEQARTLIGQFLSKPPRIAAVQGVSVPAGLLRLAVPQVTETMEQFFERLGTSQQFGPVLHVDAELIDFAFDFRPGNPTDQDNLKPPPGSDSLSALRTTDGHVLTATGHGLYYTLQRESSFVTVTDVVQHRPTRSHRLPTISINRKYIAFERQVTEGEQNALNTLAFHPNTATNKHMFGVACDELLD